MPLNSDSETYRSQLKKKCTFNVEKNLGENAWEQEEQQPLKIKDYKLPQTIYRFNEILIKIPMAYFIELEQIFQNFTWNHKRP